jgi:hypothetical protein
MTWTTVTKGSWSASSSDSAAETVAGLALPGSWPFHPPGTILVRRDQVPNLPSIEPGPSPEGTSTKKAKK